MKYTKSFLGFLLIFGFSLTIFAQNTIPATGGNASGSGGSVSYTVGQILNSTFSGTNGTVLQGVQQPYEISIVTGIEEAIGISLEIMAYPNPATDFIILIIKNYEVKNLSYQFYDINGSLLQDSKLMVRRLLYQCRISSLQCIS